MFWKKKKKKKNEREWERRQADTQSFFYINSFPEAIVITILLILIVTYFSVFTADGVVFTDIINNMETGKVPDKNQVVLKINVYKKRNGKYPENLEKVGYDKKYGSTMLEYASNGNEFELCYNYFPYLEYAGTCYYSKAGMWE